jgi:AraC-like DNA-binding protein
MTKIRPTTWVLHEPAGGSELRSLHIPLAGHLAAKADSVDLVFPRWAVGLVVKGRGEFSANESPPVACHAPFFFIVEPGLRYAYGPAVGTTWEERFIVVEGPRAQEWVANNWLQHTPVPIPVPAAEAVWLAAIHEESGDEMQRPGGSIDLAKLRLEQWLFHLSRLRRSAEAAHPIDALARRWREQPPLAADLPRIAEELHMSYSHFRAQFRERLGTSPARFLHEQRLHAARRLLSGGLPVKRVAQLTGFAHLSGFYRAFARATGSAPARYQHEIARMMGTRPPPSRGDS